MSTEVNTEQPQIETSEKEVDPMVRQLSIMAELLDTLAKTSKSLTTEMKVLTKDVNKLRSSKPGKKQKRPVDPDAPKKIGSLEKPVPISDELATFLGITAGEEYSRQYITRCINTFVKDNPSLTVRIDGYEKPICRVLLDTNLILSNQSKLIKTINKENEIVKLYDT